MLDLDRMKYSITVVADKGLKKPQYTSARLKKGEVLYLETHSIRYKIFLLNRASMNFILVFLM